MSHQKLASEPLRRTGCHASALELWARAVGPSAVVLANASAAAGGGCAWDVSFALAEPGDYELEVPTRDDVAHTEWRS